MVFISKQVSLPKISLLLQKLKSVQKAIYALFDQMPSILNWLLMHLSFNRERKKDGHTTLNNSLAFT